MVEEASPNTSEIARPWKMGSVRIKAAPIIAAAAVRKIGLKLSLIHISEPTRPY